MILFDTDIASYITRKVEPYFSRFNSFEFEEWGISSVTALELLVGNHKNPSHQFAEATHQFLKSAQIFAFGIAASQSAAILRTSLRSNEIGVEDTLIAGHAVSMNAILVSNNLKHMSRVPGLKLWAW